MYRDKQRVDVTSPNSFGHLKDVTNTVYRLHPVDGRIAKKGEEHLINQEYCPLCLDYALGEMHDDLLRKRFERHLESCAGCEMDLEEYRDLIRALTSPVDSVTSKDDAKLADALLRPTRVIPFPLRRSFRAPVRRNWGLLRNRLTTLSVSATILTMTLVVLGHTGHLPHIALIGDAAWDDVSHVSHNVIVQGAHLTHHFRHRL